MLCFRSSAQLTGCVQLRPPPWSARKTASMPALRKLNLGNFFYRVRRLGWTIFGTSSAPFHMASTMTRLTVSASSFDTS